MTNSDNYRPTLAEKKLLEVLINPEHIGKSVTELCNLAGVSRNKYYTAMKRESFRSLVNDTAMDLVKGKMSDVVNAAYKYSLEERGHQDRKMLLTMAGLYTDKQEIESTGELGIKIMWADDDDAD